MKEVFMPFAARPKDVIECVSRYNIDGIEETRYYLLNPFERLVDRIKEWVIDWRIK
jgi:hypothetical protein